jgi:hypothetical protein
MKSIERRLMLRRFRLTDRWAEFLEAMQSKFNS